MIPVSQNSGGVQFVAWYFNHAWGTLSDNIITDNGINIGDYAPGANAWIYFGATASEIPSSKNVIYRNIIQACGGYGAKEQSADVIMDTYEAL